MKTILVLGALGAVSVAIPSAAEAKPASGRPVVVVADPELVQPTRRVDYADLNLATQVGERALIRRVRGAVSDVCAEELGSSPLFYHEHACHVLTWKDARPQVNQALARARSMAAAGSPGIAATVIVVRAAE